MELLGASPGFTESVRFPWHPWMIMGLGNIASFTVGWLASVVLPAGGAPPPTPKGREAKMGDLRGYPRTT